MTTTIKVQDNSLQVDVSKTEEFYLTQHHITEDCACDDCEFYSTEFIKQPLEIFGLILKMGVDLGKNLKSEPSGVWCIREADGNFTYSQQVYQTFGHILPIDTSQIKYEKTEKGFNINALFSQTKDETIDIVLTIGKR